MSVQAETATIEPKKNAPSSVGLWWRTVDRAMDTAGDYLNPILVKETRQALKSRQFTITFALLLLCGWVWSILGVAMIGPRIWQGSQGAEMFFGYYIILAFPLLVIVPYGAFRSLAGEREDRTYELMSITALDPRQIIRGKLGSAVLQMLVYLSAISPCLAFTYLLRGIDLPTILFVLSYTILASLSLSIIGLLIGTLTTEKHWQTVLSVLMIIGLLSALYAGIGFTSIMMFWEEIPFDDIYFWLGITGWLTGHLSYFMLVYYAAAAQLTFAADNRSTRLRVVMVVQHILFVGWMAWLWIWEARGDEDVLPVALLLMGIHWWVMGALMTGESPELSPRAKRNLPQSFLGRVFFTWFNPGPGTGYLLAISSLLSGLVLMLVAIGFAEVVTQFDYYLVASQPDEAAFSRWSSRQNWQTLAFGVLGLSYVTIYLGLGLMLIRLFRRFTQVGLLLAALTHILLVMLGSGIPTVIYMMSRTLRGGGYTLLHITDPFWSLVHMIDRSSLPVEAGVLLTVVPFTALVVFTLNLPGVVAEVRHVRLAKPRRVAAEDAELSAELAPPAPVRTSPWD